MIKKLVHRFSDASIKYKLFFSYVILLVVPLSLFILITSHISTTDATNKSMESAKKVLSQASAFLEYKTSNIKNVMDIAVLDTNLQEIVTRNSSYYIKNVGNGWIDNAKFYKLTFTLHSNPDISNICMYMKDGIAAVEETDQFKTIKKVKNTEWYKSLVNSKQVFEWLPSRYFPADNKNDSIYFLRKIPSSDNINDFIGVIRVDIDSKVIADLLSQAVLTHSSSVMLSNNKNQLISYAGILNSEAFKTVTTIKPNDIEDSVWKTTFIDGQKYLIGVEKIPRTDMKMTLIVPYKDILELNVKLRNPMITIILIIIALIIPLSFVISTSGTKRIRLLTKHIKKVHRGEISVLKLKSNKDEIGSLIYNFNNMMGQITLLMDDKFKLGKEVKNKELKALQSQINPHFLYNTLDLINWMSVKYDAPEIRDVVNSLSRFYKLSLSKGQDIIPLDKEIELVVVYLQIQNMRFQNSIKYNIDIPSELYAYTIPKITLQPLVENAILHGILEKEEEDGIINIYCTLVNEVLTLKIHDDGVGMTEEQVKTLLYPIKEKEPHGYGISNINDRFRLIYGDEYGLSYESEVGSGTTVTIRLPANM